MVTASVGLGCAVLLGAAAAAVAVSVASLGLVMI
jgi:hypothetical protein